MGYKISASHDCASCPTRHLTEWKDLDLEDLSLLTTSRHTKTIPAGQSLYTQGDNASGIYCVQSGLIGLRRFEENGNAILVKTMAAGDTIGYQAFLSKKAHSHTAETLVPSAVCFIDRVAINNLLGQNPTLGERFLQRSISDLDDLEERYSKNMTMTAFSRFLHMLMVFFRQHGFEDERGHFIVDIPIRRSELAEMLGIQPESMSRLIKKAQEEGLVHVEQRRVTIVDMNSMADRAGVTA